MNDLTEIHDILRNALADFVSVCEKYRIPYYLIEGSCLGAVRHHGFIPWDDDVDVAIPEPYYDTLLLAYNKEFLDKYEVAGCLSWDDFPEKSNTLTRVYISAVNMIDESLYEKKIIHPFLDVMLLYGFDNSVTKAKIQYWRIWSSKVLLKLSDRNTIGFNVGKKRGRFEKIVLAVLQKIDTSKLFNSHRCWSRLNKVLRKYSYANSEYVSIYPSDYKQREIMPKEYYGDGAKAVFEGIEVRVPTQYDKYLTQLYGDYMQLPPEEKRISHHRLTLVK